MRPILFCTVVIAAFEALILTGVEQRYLKDSKSSNWSFFWLIFKFETDKRKIWFLMAGLELLNRVVALLASFNRCMAVISEPLKSCSSAISSLSISPIRFSVFLTNSSYLSTAIHPYWRKKVRRYRKSDIDEFIAKSNN
ncbi:hypothetical protein IIY68_03640 [Candidatus Saccharibacteria bacterium]|nr:hypothetical protein [Candidatus Saccharibacteria bacterium]